MNVISFKGFSNFVCRKQEVSFTKFSVRFIFFLVALKYILVSQQIKYNFKYHSYETMLFYHFFSSLFLCRK